MKKMTAKILVCALLTQGLHLPLAFAAEPKEIQVCKEKSTNWDPFYLKSGGSGKNISTRCSKATAKFKTECLSSLESVETLNNEFKNAFNESCKSVRAFDDKIRESALANQKEATEAAATAADTGITGLTGVVAKIDEAIKKSIESSKRNVASAQETFKTSPSIKTDAQAKSYVEKMTKVQNALNGNDLSALEKADAKSITISKANEFRTKDENFSASSVSVAQSFEFVRQLMTNKKDINSTISKLTAERDKLNQIKDGFGPGPTDTDTTTSTTPGSGFDPSSLLALAPLAAMLAQKQQTPPTTPDPFQSGITNQNPPPAPLAAAKLNGKSGSGEPKAQPGETKPEETAKGGSPSPYADAFTGAEDSPSDITKGGLGSGAHGGGGVSSAGSPGGGGSSSSEGSADSKGRSTASNPATDEALQGFGGGGLNFGGGGSSSTNSHSESVADPMKDMLTDMEQSVDGGGFDANLGEGGEAEQAGGDILMEDSESLFPRVRACHSRALKKGWVLNGLGEKLSELDD